MDVGLIGAMATLVGIAVTAVIGWLGQRAGNRAEQRLKIDSAVHAADLLSEKDGRAPTPATAASVLLGLAELGQIDLATALLVDLWPKRAIPDEVAILLVGKALVEGTDTARLMAAEQLWYRAPALNSRKSTDWPHCVDGRWLTKLGPLTKLLLLDALLRMTYQQQPDRFTMPALAVRLWAIREQEQRDQDIRQLAGVLLTDVVGMLDVLKMDVVLHADQLVTAKAIRAVSVSEQDWSSALAPQLKDRLTEMREWFKHGKPERIPRSSEPDQEDGEGEIRRPAQPEPFQIDVAT